MSAYSQYSGAKEICCGFEDQGRRRDSGDRCRLDPAAFGAVLRSWANLLSVRLQAAGKHIAVDGKTSRRSFDRANGQPALHTVSAFLSEAGLVLGQCKTSDKSNEITAIPELWRMLE